MQLTIRQRLPLYISISAFFILVLQSAFIYEYNVWFYEQEFQSRLQQRLDEADSLIHKEKWKPSHTIHLPNASDLPEEEIIYATDARQLSFNDGLNPKTTQLDTVQFHNCKYCFKHIGQRDYGIKHDSITHHTLVVSAVDRYGLSKIRNLKSGLILGIIFGVLLLTFVSWFWVKTMLQPISDKIKKARAIGEKSLNLRLNVKNSTDELGQLALTFNEMLERIEKSFRTHQQFVRNASHEIRTPLTTITAEADMALQENRSPEYQREALQIIRQQAENLGDLVAQLLLVAKVDTTTAFIDEPCPSDEVLLKTIQNIQHKYPLGSQAIQLHIDAPDASHFLVKCDPTILQAAFANLIENAIKYGSNQPITVRLFSDDKWVRFEVKDNGMGIAADDLGQIFIPFYRSKLHSHLPGSGIGLTLVKNIAEKYQGKVYLTSNLNQGTLVQFDLPRYNV
ncbi:MAG: HAMP domain-containing sensor histidine kinase [Saprospiraceae bacterium]